MAKEQLRAQVAGRRATLLIIATEPARIYKVAKIHTAVEVAVATTAAELELATSTTGGEIRMPTIPLRVVEAAVMSAPQGRAPLLPPRTTQAGATAPDQFRFRGL
jgi:hypothetical protein